MQWRSQLEAHSGAFWGINRIGNIGLQGFGKRAAIHFCALVGQVGLHVDIHFSADLTPEVAEGVVFGQIAFAFRIDHAVEEAVVQAFVFRAVVAVGDVVQLGVGLYHFSNTLR